MKNFKFRQSEGWITKIEGAGRKNYQAWKMPNQPDVFFEQRRNLKSWKKRNFLYLFCQVRTLQIQIKWAIGWILQKFFRAREIAESRSQTDLIGGLLLTLGQTPIFIGPFPFELLKWHKRLKAILLEKIQKLHHFNFQMPTAWEFF